MSEEQLNALRERNKSFKPQPTPINPAFGMGADGTPASGPTDFLSPAQVDKASSVVNNEFDPEDPSGRTEGDPGFVERTKTWGASMMASLFDYSDTEEKVKNNENLINNPMDVIETGWDLGVVWPLFKLYERINQAGSYAGAAFPGGIDRLSWDQAGLISPGQVATLNVETSLTDTDDPMNLLNLFATGAGVGLGVTTAGGDILPDDFQDDPSQFLSPERKEEVFGEGRPQLVSGAYDFIWALVVDPLLFVPAGKAVKFARLRFVDEALKTTDDYTAAQQSLASDAAALKINPTMETSQMSGFGQDVRFVQNATDTEFVEFTSRYGNQDIWASVRGVSRNAFGRQLDEADRFELGALILRAQGLGDEKALQQLVDSQPGITKIMIQAAALRRAKDLSPDGAVTANQFNRRMEGLANSLEESLDNLARAPEGSPAQAQAQIKFEQDFADFFDITSSDNPLQRVAQLASLSAKGGNKAVAKVFADYKKFDGEAIRQIEAMAAAADQTIARISNYNQGLTQATRVGRNNALGRANQARRLKNVQKTASIVPFSGGVRQAISQAYDVGTWNGVRMTLRLWRLPGVERPAGLINLRGLKGADNLREVRATIFSTRTFAGAPKIIDGKEVGGVERGEEILAKWLKKYDQVDLDGANGLAAFRELEEQIAKEVWTFQTASGRGADKADLFRQTEKGYNAKTEEQVIKAALEEANKGRMHQMKNLERGQAYWMEGNELQGVPISDAQMADSLYMYNFRAFEDSLIRSDASLAVRRNVLGVYAAFNDLWRPAVLFRLGYPVRNVGEGIIRASLYEMSFRPIIDAFTAGRDGAGNLISRREKKAVKKQSDIVKRLTKEAEESGDPAAVRAVRDKKFQRWLQSEVITAETRVARAKDTVAEARRVLEDVKKNMPEGTLRADVEPTMAGIRGSQGLEAGDVRVKNASQLLEGKTRVSERGKSGDAGAPQGKFGDSSDFGVDYADFLPSGQVLLTRKGTRKTKDSPARPKTTVVVKTPGNLLGGKGYKFDPNRRFTIKEINETNNTITFTAGNRTYTEPIEIVQSAQPSTAANRLRQIIDDNNRQFVERQTVERGKEAVRRFDRMLDAELPQVGLARTASGDIDEYMMRQYAEAIENLDLALLMEREMLDALVEVRNTKSAIRRYGQQRVTRHMQYATQISQDLGSQVVTALVKASDTDAFNPDGALRSVAIDAASAGTTTRAQLSLDSRINANNLRQELNKEFVDVTYSPRNRDRYFAGNARQLQQMYDGDFGRLVMTANTEVVNGQLRLTAAAQRKIMQEFQTRRGQEVWKFLTSDPDAPWAPKAIRKGTSARSRDDVQRAGQEAYLNTLLNQFERLTPSGELRAAIQNGTIKPSKEADFLSDVKRLNGDPNIDQKRLLPIVGDQTVYSGGPRTPMDWVRGRTARGFEIIGQMPEDAFVRMPFYGRRYREVYEQRLRLAAQSAQQNGRQMISGRELGEIVRRSHMDALRETKRYLYTIERRTWLGDNFEKIMPFISAGQNAVQAVGRLTSRDPSAAALIAFLWSRPYASGDIVNEENEISLAWTETLLPGWLKDAGLSDVGIDVGSINLLFPETGYGLIHRPGPVVTVPAGEMMKRGFILQPYAPGALKAVFGEEFSEQTWLQFQKYLFGDSGGPAPSAVRAVLPAWMVKTLDLFQGEEGSKAYAYALDSNIRGMLAEVQAGERDFEGMDELWNEARDRTNGWFMVRLAFNALAPTSPKLHPTIEPLVDEYRHYQQQYGREADRLFNEVHGPNLAYIGSAKGSRNIAGVDATTEAAKRAAKYAGLTQYLGDDLADNPDLLGIILNDPDPDAEYVYNASVLRQQENQKIPGLSKTYRSMQTPQESLLSSSTGAGWTEYLRFRERLESTATKMGLESYQDSPELMDYMKQKRAQMASDPMYSGWYSAYLDNGNSRLESTLKVMRKLTSNNVNAMEYAMDDSNVERVNGMQEYLTARGQMLEMERQSGSGIGAKINFLILDQWHSYIRDLKMRNRTFAAFWERYLYSDMDGLSFEGVSYDSYAGGALNG